MEPSKDLNGKLKEEVNKIFEDLFRKIGNNRQQLANKVIGFHKEINKELTKTTVDAKREVEIRREVAGIEKMAAKQLPHLERTPPRTATPVAAPAPAVAKAPAPAAPKVPAPVEAKVPAPVKTKAAEPVKAKAQEPVKAKVAASVKPKTHAPAKPKKKK
jgi:hypothetical protein